MLQKKNNAPVIAVGDIVTVMAENKSHRGSWKLAKVEEVIKGTDMKLGVQRCAQAQLVEDRW